MIAVDTCSASAVYAVLPEVAECLLNDGTRWGFRRWLEVLPTGQQYIWTWAPPAHLRDKLRTRDMPPLERVASPPLYWEDRLFLGRSWSVLNRIMRDGGMDRTCGSGVLRQVVVGDMRLVDEENRLVAFQNSDLVREAARAVQPIDEQTFRDGFARAYSGHPGHLEVPSDTGDYHYAWRRFRELQRCYQLAAKHGWALFLVAFIGRFDVARLETRLRPNACSDCGFLGPNDNLRETIEVDARLLDRLGICHEHVAAALEAVMFGGNWWFKQSSYRRDLVGTSVMNIEAEGGGTGFGWQECPWGCESNEMDFIYALKGCYSLRNLRTGERMKVPGLSVHLAREHHFFEGLGTYYRTDPERLVRILELQPCSR